MRPFSVPRNLGGFIALAFFAWTAQAHDPAPTQRGEKGLIVLPDPTPEQRERGRQLLDKILKVVQSIPLTDSERVLNELGFDVLTKRQRPTFEAYLPKTEDDADRARTYAKSGFTGISTIKYTVLPPPPPWSQASLTASLDRANYCISVDDGRQTLSPIFKKESTEIRTPMHPSRYARQQSVSILVFEYMTHPVGHISSFVLSYEYQKCAERITVNYNTTSGGNQP